MSTESSEGMAAQEEIQRLRTRIAELEVEKQIADELPGPGEQYQVLFNTLIEGFCIIEVILTRTPGPSNFACWRSIRHLSCEPV
jgi:hypothetical protein